MKGLVKAVKRTPHMVTTKVGMSKKSNDPEFDEYARKFAELETSTEKLLKDARLFSENCLAMLTAGVGFASHFAIVFQPIGAEVDLLSTHPDAEIAIRNCENYTQELEDLKATLQPELELIEARVVAPVKEFQLVLKQVRKSITKRDHKLVDYDRFNNSLTKLREKKEKTLNDEKNLFKLEQDFEVAANDYDFWNATMKAELPQFMVMTTRFIDPLFHSFFFMQLNIFYLMMEKLQGFMSGKINPATHGSEIISDYQTKRGDVGEVVDSLSISKRIISTSRMMQQQRANSTLTTGSAGVVRSPSTISSTNSSLSRAGTTASALKKTPPPPPTSKPGGYAPSHAASAAPPPPYTPPAASSNAMAAATKRAPPPPPGPKPTAPKPPAVKYVVALYDFDAQADGDLSFRTGDRIELLEKTASSEDWWTGRVNGRKGVFPGNYVQET